jgi:anti-anti-sigma regulatory factor
MMFRITLQEEPAGTTLRLEGRVVGPWVAELTRSWPALISSPGSRKLLIDLCGVTHVDRDGMRILAEIHETTGANFVADTPMTKYFAAEARRDKKNPTREEA